MTDSRASDQGAAAGLRCDIDAKALADTLAQAMRGRASRTSVAVLAGVKLEATAAGTLAATGTDMEITIRATTAAEVSAPGVAVVEDPRALLAVAKTLAGAVTVAHEDAGDGRGEVVLVSWSGARYAFAALPAEDYPSAPTFGVAGEVAAAPFAEVVGHVLPCASKDESRPVLTGVLLELAAGRVSAAATDSYRLAVDADDCGGEREPYVGLVPGRALAEVLRLAKRRGAPEWVYVEASTERVLGPQRYGGEQASAATQPRWVAFKVGAVTVTARSIEGQFPNVAQLRPENWELEATLQAGELAAAAKRLGGMLGRSEYTPLRLAFAADGTATVRLVHGDGLEASETLPTPAALAWEPRDDGELQSMPECGFNPALLRDAAAFAGDGEMRMRLVSPLRPATILNGRADAWYLLMPIRLAG